jgi:DAPG hydrolase PhiG domain
MHDALPEPIFVPWTMKPLSSAQTRSALCDDGRLHLAIRHDVLHGVTPEMLVWWFGHMDGEMAVEGVRYPRYRVWHPRDHVRHRYVRRSASVGPGAVFEIHEVLGRNPAHRVHTLTDVTQLDLAGFAHRPRTHGLRVARMDYAWKRVPGGTLYENSLTVGLAGRGPLIRAFNALIRRYVFDESKGRAWLLHNVEEVGNFEFFLPGLYAAERSAAR